MAEYLTAPPDELDMEEDDDEFETMLDRATMPVEGVRINSELFDAYYPPSWTTAAATTRRSLPAAGPPTPALSDDSQSQTPPGLSPPSTTRAPAVSVWALPPAAPASLSLARQPSLRRTSATRARTVDFNDFTAHRRASTRTAASAPAPAPAAAEPGAGAGDEPWMRAGASARATRRFFPFSYQTRPARHGGARTDELFDRGGVSSSDEALYLTETEPEPEPEQPASYFSFPTPASTTSAGAAPRLRRGGVRPPESLLLRRVSPVLSVLEGGAPRSPGSASVGDDAPVGSAAEAEAASYPTPEPGPSE